MIVDQLLSRLGLSKHKAFLRGSSIVAIIQISGLGLVFLLQIYLARLINDAEQYGLYAWGQSLLFMMGAICAVGVPIATSKFVAAMNARDDEYGIRQVSRQALRIISIASLLILSVSLLTVFFFIDTADKKISLDILLLALIFAPVVAVILLHKHINKARRWLVLGLLPFQVGRPAITVILVTFIWLSYDRQLSGVQALSMTAASLLIVAILQVTIYHYRVRKLPTHTHSTKIDLWSTAFPIYLARLAGLVTTYSGIFLLGIIVSPIAAGAYFAAERLASLAAIPLSIVTTVSAPGFAAAHAKDNNVELQMAASQAAHGSFWPTLIIAGSLLIFGHWLLSLFNASYSDAALVLAFLVVGKVANVFPGAVSSLLNMTGHHKIATKIAIVSAAVHLLMMVLLLPWLGAIGAAIATMTSSVISNLWMLYHVRQRLGIKPTVLSNL